MTTIRLSQGQLAFTYCQVPIVYEQSDYDALVLTLQDGSEESHSSLVLPSDVSKEIFARSGKIVSVKVLLEER
jgi:hypothetical protein